MVDNLDIKYALWNIGYAIKEIPFNIAFNINCERNKRRRKAEERKTQEENKTVFNEVEKENPASELSDEMVSNIKEVSDDIVDGTKLIKKALETDAWIRFVKYYHTTENPQIPKVMDYEMRFINGLSEYFGFGKIYESAESHPDITVYDPRSEKYSNSGNFLLYVSDLETHKNDIYERINAKANGEEVDPIHPIFNVEGEEGTGKTIVHPIWFDPERKGFEPETLPTQGTDISDELFKKLEDAIVPIIGANRTHRYEMCDNHLVKLTIDRELPGVQEDYIIDPGIVMGFGKVSVMVDIPGDKLFVPTDKTEIISKVLATKFYPMFPEEIEEVAKEGFSNKNIYRYIDMSDTDNLSSLSKEELKKLEDVLTTIIEYNRQINGNFIPRFRFNMFNSVNDFIIISDYSVKSPLSATNETSNIIAEGLMYIIKDDKITQKFKDIEVSIK